MMLRISLLVCCALFFSSTTTIAKPFPAQSRPGEDIGNSLGAGYETSGIVWHSRLERFITVDDGGKVSTIDIDGNNVKHLFLRGDLEGITIADPSTNFVYVGREDGNSIVEFDIVNGGRGRRRFSLAPWMQPAGNAGLEALTFVSDPDDPEGGLFYAGQQSNGKIYAFRLPIVSSSTSRTVEFLFSFQAAPGRTDLSGLHYDAANNVLYAIWDSNNILRAMRPDGTFLEEWRLPGSRQEGITFRGTDLLIAQDRGPDVIRYSNFPVVVPEPTTGAFCVGAVMILLGTNLRLRRPE